MKLTAVIKLMPTPEQRQMLFQTLERANAACNFISEQAWQTKTFGRVPIHHLTYKSAREQFELTAQMAVRCIGKVADSYKLDKKIQRAFRKHGAIAYDDRILRYELSERRVSIWCLSGRERIAFTAGESQLHLLQFQHGESDLVLNHGNFYLSATCEVPEDKPIDIKGFLGVDLGVKSIAVDSDGNIHSAKHLLNVRHRHRRLRSKLQKKGTRSAKRRLIRLSGKEQRFARDVNHCVSKQLVYLAKGTQRGIALEDLGGIRDRVTVRRKQRDQLHSWSFHQLRTFITYKACWHGVPLVLVDPRNTSRQCASCGHIDKASRKSQSVFVCTSCGHAAHADVNAARNISGRGAVNHPYVTSVLGRTPASVTSP